MKFKKIVSTFLLTGCFLFTGFTATSVFAGTTVEIKNSGFESSTDGNWDLGNNASIVTTNPKSGSKCLKIQNNKEDFSSVCQKVELKPNTGYKLTCYIKGSNIQQGNIIDGANISVGDENEIHMIDFYNNWNTGTFDWIKATVYFETTSVTKATIQCRLGHFWKGCTGTAYFDNIKLEECPYPNDDSVKRERIEGKHIVLAYTKNCSSILGSEKYRKMLSNLDEAYEKYAELTGSTPCHGDKIYIINTDEPAMQNYGALSNFNPIVTGYNQEAVFRECKEKGGITFGILHELGHKFDEKHIPGTSFSWNSDIEFWANAKMLYVMDATDDITAIIDGYSCSSSADLSKFFKSINATGAYDITFAKGKYSGEGLTYLFCEIIKKIGHDPFKKAFRYYVDNDNNDLSSLCNYNKLLYFLNLLQYYTNPESTEVFDVLDDYHLDIIQKEYETNFRDVRSFAVLCEADGELMVNKLNSNSPIHQIRLVSPYASLLQYRVLVDGEWSDWKNQGALAGNPESNIDCISVRIADSKKDAYNVYFRASDKDSYTNWTTNGGIAGNSITGNGITGFEVALFDKNSSVQPTDVEEISKLRSLHRVTLRNKNNRVIRNVFVYDNSSPFILDQPFIEGYLFKGWSESLLKVTEEKDVHAEYESCDTITIYYDGIYSPYVYYRKSGSSDNYTTQPMYDSEGTGNCTYRACINVEKGQKIQTYFASQNRSSIDNNNYEFTPGTYTITGGVVKKIDDTNMIHIKQFYSVNGVEATPSDEMLFDVEASGGREKLQYKYTYFDKNGDEHTIRDYSEYSRLSRIFDTDVKYLKVYVTDGFTTESMPLYIHINNTKDFRLYKLESTKGTSIKVGETTTIFAGLTGGYSDYRYEFTLNGRLVSNSVNYPICRFSPELKGRYVIGLTATDSRGSQIKRKLIIYVS